MQEIANVVVFLASPRASCPNGIIVTIDGERAAQGLPENPLALFPVPRSTVLAELRDATVSCRPRYTKGKVSFELLARVDPARVEATCPHARALLDALRALRCDERKVK